MSLNKKRYKWIALVASFALVAYGCDNGEEETGAAENSGEEVSDNVIRVGATGQSFPNSYREGDELIGYDVEVLEHVAEHLGYEVDWTLASFDGLMGQLANNQIDTIANAFEVTEERAETYDFTTPYTYTSTGIAVHADSPFETVDDLDGETVGGVSGSNKVTILENHIEETGLDIDIRLYDTREGPQNDTENRRIAGYVQGKPILQSAINLTGLDFRILPDDLDNTEIAFPFLQNEEGEAFIEEFNEALEELREDGTLEELSLEYFGEDNTTED